MEPILLIHGYSSEGKNTPASRIYGELPNLLKNSFGADKVREINLARWISLDDGISLRDVSFALDRALKKEHQYLLESGFHVVVHSTGALVIRDWIKTYSCKPSPVKNLVHMAGANFGSGLAHIGRGQLARWGRFLFSGTEPGMQILNELEFGSWKTLDLHKHFLEMDHKMRDDYEVQEFCLIGSQALSGSLQSLAKIIPIRYIREDSSDNTVRTAASNPDFIYIPVTPLARTAQLSAEYIEQQIRKREQDKSVSQFYHVDKSYLENSPSIPFALLYETAHSGKDLGIVQGKHVKRRVLPLLKKALKTPFDKNKYERMHKIFNLHTEKTLLQVAALKKSDQEWNKQAQYEAHCQVIFRIRDQYGNRVSDSDITFRSVKKDNKFRLEKMIEDRHENRKYPGTFCFYFRTARFNGRKRYKNLLDNISDLNVEITAYEAGSKDICFVPLNVHLSAEQLQKILKPFKTTVFDITLQRLPAARVFSITKA